MVKTILQGGPVQWGWITFQGTFPIPGTTPHQDDIHPAAPSLNHERNEFRWILKVGVHDDHGVP
jgi:hypothetical protein